MTILERLATTQEPVIAEMIKTRREPSDEENLNTPRMENDWDNRPAWDNWTQKPPPFKKKTNYFRKK
jgi:hypothetical protein